MTYKNGQVYQGEWALDCPQGKGTLTYSDGTTIYHGYFDDGEKHGEGTLIFADKTKIVGQWNRGMPTQGTIITKNSDKIKGSFTDEEFSGNGTIQFANGDFYKGRCTLNHTPYRIL